MFRPYPDWERCVFGTTLLKRFHRRLRRIGVDGQFFGLHSFRSGGATAAALGLRPERLVKVHGHWHSGVVRTYMCAQLEELWGRAAAMT